MKKLSFLVIVFLSFFLLVSCSNPTDNSSNYKMTKSENGTDYVYTLTLDESKNTFLISKNDSQETKFSGAFSSRNGYYILQSEQNGIQYVKIDGDSFSYFIPDGANIECQHNFVVSKNFSGDCLTNSYILYKCSLCGKEKKEIGKLGEHNFISIKKKSGTCKEKSCEVFRCSICSEEKIVYGDYGSHCLSDSVIKDSGCQYKQISVKKCTLCDYKEEVELDSFGSHNRVNGVCTHCNFDTIGLCHSHKDENQNAICDSCLSSINIFNSIKEKGYYFNNTDNSLYAGSFPISESSVNIDDIIKYGKYDNDTGYIRYKCMSYLIEEKNGIKKAFSIQPIKWQYLKSVSNGAIFICSSILEGKVFQDAINTVSENITNSNPESQFSYNKFYFNKENYVKNSDSNILANSWKNCDLFKYANNEFLTKNFSSLFIEKLVGNVDIPSKALFDNLTFEGILATSTDYSTFTNSANDKENYFTCDVFDNPDSYTIGNSVISYNNSSISSVLINMEYGFVPVITLSIIVN